MLAKILLKLFSRSPMSGENLRAKIHQENTLHTMSDIKTYSLNKIALSFTAVILAASSAQAYDVTLRTNWPAISFHGFASQGFLLTDTYNYLDNDTKDGSFRFSEAGLNAAINPFPRTRVTAQAFMFDVGDIGRYDVVLDYASVEYTFNDYLGVRGGRLRRPQGIYNQIVDLDLARTSVLLPQGLYDARWRDFYAAFDGGEIFGTLPLKKAGSLSYEIYTGQSSPTPRGGVGETIRNSLPPGSAVNQLNSPLILGEQIWWNTPLDGLRAGVAWQHAWGFKQNLTVRIPTPNGPLMIPATSYGDVDLGQLSLEYVWKHWTFQAEYQRLWLEPGNIGDGWYVGAAYRFNKWFEAGTYYTESYNNVMDRGGSKLPVPSDAFQKDVALSLRFDLTDWWIFKVEGHCLNGTGLLFDNAANPVRNGNGWFMLAFKTTLSF
jgi:hypothetical protein